MGQGTGDLAAYCKQSPSVSKPASPDVPRSQPVGSQRTVSLEHSLELLGLNLGAGSTVVRTKLDSAYEAGVFWSELSYGRSPESGHPGGLAS